MKDLDILKKSLMKMLSGKHQSKRPVSWVTPSTSRGNKRGSSNNVAKKGGYSSNVESIHGAIQKLAKISDENKKQTEIHEFDAFCSSLAIQLKKMPLRQALICQEKLQAVMTQHCLSPLSSENLTSPLHIYTSTPSPASTFWTSFTHFLS